jgi:hypothetical protein
MHWLDIAYILLLGYRYIRLQTEVHMKLEVGGNIAGVGRGQGMMLDSLDDLLPRVCPNMFRVFPSTDAKLEKKWSRWRRR